MRKITHKKLKTKARKMMSREEIKLKTPIFQSKAWTFFRAATMKRLDDNKLKIKAKREANKQHGTTTISNPGADETKGDGNS